ncbi:tautomerase PptA [Streptomyces broussonetiae]|uniref:Tautomerase PptA n=1 Tax=Streptomyces broussonetiae TaxID=2686304 RepID=A0A6I6NE89_9ACTN|nr:tautomerase PptA [Streptomyces broussonetiae]QHA07245.1 tautomerase PptA [Streptomyces broussonetiae]
MPHVHIKHFPKDLTDEQRQRLAEAVTTVVVEHFGTYEGAVSIALEPVAPEAWETRVTVPDVQGKAELLIKEPHYRTA